MLQSVFFIGFIFFACFWIARLCVVPDASIPDTKITDEWMQRTHQLPIHQWYNETAKNVVLPLRALLFEAAAHLESMGIMNRSCFYVLPFVLVGFPCIWMWCYELAKLVLRSGAEREQSLDHVLPECNTLEAAIAEEEKVSKVWIQHRGRLANVGCSVLFMNFIPLFMLENHTLRPLSLGVVLGFGALYALLRNEDTLILPSPLPFDEALRAHDGRFFDVTKPAGTVGNVSFFKMRQTPTSVYLWLFVVFWCLAMTLEPVFLYAAPAVAVWALKASYNRRLRHVLAREMVQPSPNVKVTVPFVRIGLSFYTDKQHMYRIMSALILGIFLVCVAPFLVFSFRGTTSEDVWRITQRVLPTLSLKTGIPTTANLTTFSVTGATETGTGSCSYSPNSWCPVPVANVWFITEYYGIISWTNVAEFVVETFSTFTGEREMGAAVSLFQNTTILCVGCAHAIPLFLFFACGGRVPPVVFDTAQGRRRILQQMDKQRHLKGRQHTCGEDAKEHKVHPTSESNTSGTPKAKAKHSRSTVMTILSREEYILKQVTFFCWFFIISVILCGILTVSRDDVGNPRFAALAVPVGALLTIYVMRYELRRMRPDIFGKGTEENTVRRAFPPHNPLPERRSDGYCLLASLLAMVLSCLASTLPYAPLYRTTLRIGSILLVAFTFFIPDWFSHSRYAYTVWAILLVIFMLVFSQANTLLVEAVQTEWITILAFCAIILRAGENLFRMALTPEKMELFKSTKGEEE